MKKYIFAVLAVAAVLSSCSKSLELNEENNSRANAITTIEASSEITTRAVVSSSDNTKVNWESGDQLGVWGTNSPSEDNLEFTLDGDGGSTTGTFKNGSSSITAISAVMYPYQATASWDGTNSKLICEIPSLQKATKVNSFDKDAAVMYSIGNTTNVKLSYAVNFLKVTVSETNVHAISISSSTTALSGKMEITSTGVTEASDGSLKGVTLIPATDDVLPTGDYYIAVKAGNIADPTISYVYYNDDHTATEKSKAGSGTLTFASGTNVKPISVDFTSGTITTRNAVQLWAGGPYWATYNVGVTDGQTTSYGDYYAWGGSQNKGDDYNTGEDKLSGCNDTATKLWGTNWRMPTIDEFSALISSDNCELEYKNGDTEKYLDTSVKGLLCKSKNAFSSNCIFLPAGTSSDGSSGNSYYWSSEPYFTGAKNLYINKNFTTNPPQTSQSLRTMFYHVRAVLE